MITLIIDGQRVEVEPGQQFIVGGKLYAICPDCGKLVQLNKLVFGGLHFCE